MNRLLKKQLVKRIPEDDPLLDRIVCPFCGAVDSISNNSYYDRSNDLFMNSYDCAACGHKDELPDYVGQAKNFGITLREFRKR